ncbi:cytochrome C-551 [Pseudomonas aeruginosa]|nr:cytochrome C-551 [Pseudomonas aeruginosa]MEB4970915.1 cytochrome C-551 [Pseudomonas aeruginosa]
MKPYALLSLLATGTLLAQGAWAEDPEVLFKNKGCAACHAIDTKMVGPAYKDVAAKFAGQAGAEAELAQRIKNGSQGVWGPIPMPPNAVSDDEAQTLAKWVLSQK